MTSLKNFLIFLIGLFLLVGLYFLYNHLTFAVSGSPGLVFKAEKCREPGPAVQKITSIQQQGEDLVVKGVIDPNCEVKQLVGKYEIEENQLLLSWDQKTGSIAACLCPTEVVYRIKDMGKNEYQVKFEK